jgi:calcineurin-like phosphoesterase family protein
MSNIFFTADLHFGHWTNPERNIIKYCNRPFQTIEEMDSVLIKKWNDKVGKKDKIYVIGDFALCKKELLPYYMTNLNGEKIFLHGDHDKLFSDNLPYLMNLSIYNQPIVLSHWAMRTWWKSHFNSWNLYAHSHGKLEPIGKSWDVGVDNTGFSPLSWDEIVEIMKNRPDNPNLVQKRE